MKSFFIILTCILLLSGNGLAATGDIVYQCNFEGGNLSDPKSVLQACANTTVGLTSLFNNQATIPTGGWNNGRYLKVTHPSAPSDDSTNIFSAYPSKTNLREWTVTYYEKFDHWPLASPNTKSSRIYHTGGGGGGYYGALVGAHMNYEGGMYMSPWESADVKKESNVITAGPLITPDSARFCTTDLGGGSYKCNGDILNFSWTTDSGKTDKYGADRWTKIRLHTKLPSTDSASDGAITMWIDEKLAFTATNVKSSNAGLAPLGYPGAGGQTFTRVSFYPSDAATERFAHSYDDIVIYEGKVLPGNNSGTLNAPSNLKIVSQ